MRTGVRVSCDLDVDTERMRDATARLREAAEALLPPVEDPATLPGHAAGGSAPGRQALRAMVSRSDQAVLAVTTLGAVANELATLLEGVATQFDTVEALCRAGG